MARWIIMLVAAGALSACFPADQATRVSGDAEASRSVKRIYWSDGDSGRLDGQKFRLADIDAPETGGVGSVGGAKCESERDLGFESKAFMVELTRNAEIEIIRDYGRDRYDRLIVDLLVDGQDLAETGIASGHIRPWPHDGTRALARKPDWCGG